MVCAVVLASPVHFTCASLICLAALPPPPVSRTRRPLSMSARIRMPPWEQCVEEPPLSQPPATARPRGDQNGGGSLLCLSPVIAHRSLNHCCSLNRCCAGDRSLLICCAGRHSLNYCETDTAGMEMRASSMISETPCDGHIERRRIAVPEIATIDKATGRRRSKRMGPNFSFFLQARRAGRTSARGARGGARSARPRRAPR